MALKPCIFDKVTGVLGTRKFKKGLYVSSNDYAVLEDHSGRIRIRPNDKFNPHYFVTGTVMALKGISDSNGFFDVKDFCFATIAYGKDFLP
jgi:hypothetical protein